MDSQSSTKSVAIADDDYSMPRKKTKLVAIVDDDDPSPRKKTKLVAIVDDDDSMRSALQGLLKSVGLPAQAYGSAEEFLNSGQHRQTACLIADIRMPGMSGLELQAKLNIENCRIPTIFITAHGDAKMRMQALRAGAVEFLSKPFDDEALLESVRAALES
jgi:FixJ family two-component response regulator